ncbi:glycogen debranching N-terminal domain-containing protein [Actinotalea subterranea]|uniref:glycogen debranching N-terminal domain-containing protein n=1 Tax=Actinotalea subterranea TaxID=2607497 RepID=UPI0011ECF132|nr:glycogen debranching N-terminal domain-containing protein [Actinotalea subterranea]
MPESPSAPGRQPRLSTLATLVNAPGTVLSDQGGDVGVTAIEGYFLDDRRVLSSATLTVGGQRPEHLATAYTGPGSAEFTSVVAGIATSAADFGLDGDPQLSVTRRRTLDADGLLEHIELRSASTTPMSTTVALTLGSDGTTVSTARSGEADARITPSVTERGDVVWPLEDAQARTSFEPAPAALTVRSDGLVAADWDVELAPGSTCVLTARTVAVGELAAPACVAPPHVTLEAAEPVTRLFARSLADAYALVRTDVGHPEDRYVSAGAPWYLTLFGRDSLWSARMLLPFDTGLALGTLRALARHQGTRHDPVTAEQPGKILHELRRARVARLLPEKYFGTADATSLWIVLLAETWRWGADEAAVRQLLPHLRAALGWLEEHADSDHDGFVDYRPDPAGLSNQGWKDSRDAIHDAAGDEHPGTVALAEVQAYAHQAALGAADLLDAFDQPGAAQWRQWAQDLRRRFTAHFWTRGAGGPYPAVAMVDRTRRADAVTSNMGHLLGTGIVDADESAAIADRLAGSDLDSGFGLRTLSAHSPRYNPISYHNGSVWPHDTAIAVSGLASTGHSAVAAALAHGLIAAGEHFDYRLPELWSGVSTTSGPGGTLARPLPYPTACSPQAWSAASAVAVVTAALGIRADIPDGRVWIAPPRPSILGPFTLRGIRLPGGPLDVSVDDDGAVTVLAAPAGVTVVT